MNTSKALQPPASKCSIRIADHILNLHSHNMQSDEDKPDVVFLIGAPARLEPQGDATEAWTMHLYLDPAGCPPRALSGNAWQIHCEESVAESVFHGWAQQCILLMIESIVGPNLMGFCFVSQLSNLLRETTGERIVARLVPLDQTEQFSQSLAGIPIQDAWLAIFSHVPSIELFSHIATLFEDQIHPEGRLLCSVNVLQQGEESLLLLTTQPSQSRD